MGLQDMRTPYRRGRLERDDLADDPLLTLRHWLEDALEAGQKEPNAMALATADGEGRPSARMVLLKGVDERGLTFYTNHGSRKARQLAENPVGAVTFWWDLLERQVRMEGPVVRLSEEESRGYFESRPHGSRLGAWASHQSEPIESRDVLDERLAALGLAWPEGSDVPKPPFWGGYLLVPIRAEFWQGRENRLHDRFSYERDAGGWTVRRLSP